MPVSNSAPIMKAPLCYNIRKAGLFFVGKQAKVNAFAAKVNFGSPLSGLCMPRNASDTAAFVVRSRAALVLRIDRRSGNAQIGNSVVCSIPVDVVNHAVRPFAKNVKPSKTMRRESLVINTNKKVPRTAYAASNLSGLPPSAIPSATVALSGKSPGVFVVIEKFAQAVGINSHA